MITSSGICGEALGAIFGGKLVTYGRRNVAIMISVFGFVGSGITVITSPYAIIVGRFTFGLSAGFSSVCIPRYVEETVPTHLYGMFGTIFPAS